MNAFDYYNNATTFNEFPEFLLANAEQIKQICELNDNYFWNRIDESQYIGFDPCIDKSEFYKLLKFEPFNKYTKQIKRNRMKEINVLYDEHVLNVFIETYPYRGVYEENCYGYVASYINKYDVLHSEDDEYECIGTWLMALDGELAYTYFYHFWRFQQFKPFIEHKQNYEQRHIRLLVIHEHTFNEYDANNPFSSVFSNDYLVKKIMRFL